MPARPRASTPPAPRRGGGRHSSSGRLVRVHLPPTMDASTEGRLLRLAIAKGLLTWEALDRIVEALPEGESRGDRSWLRLVQDAGLLDAAQVEALHAELSSQHSGERLGRVLSRVPVPGRLAALPRRAPARVRRHGIRIPRLRSGPRPPRRPEAPPPE